MYAASQAGSPSWEGKRIVESDIKVGGCETMRPGVRSNAILVDSTFARIGITGRRGGPGFGSQFAPHREHFRPTPFGML